MRLLPTLILLMTAYAAMMSIASLAAKRQTIPCAKLPFQQQVQAWAQPDRNLRVLVTGAAGFIGSHVADYCATQMRMRVVGVDDLSGGFVSNTDLFVAHGGVFVKGDLRSAAFVDELFAQHGPFDVVYHIAAYAAEVSLGLSRLSMGRPNDSCGNRGSPISLGCSTTKITSSPP